MSEIYINVQPVGVKVFPDPQDDLQDIAVFRGTSYCDAVRRVTGNGELLILSDSILTCQWSPVILGLKNPENSFEKRLTPRMNKTWGVYLAPLTIFSERDFEPDVIILRDKPDLLKKLLLNLGWDRCALRLAGEMDKSALGILYNNNFSLKSFSIVGFNKLLASLSGNNWWHSFTEVMFRNTFVCDIFDRFISLFMSDMSICRNSTVIPYKTGLVNVSHFCIGGISWGLNYPEHLTSGFPYDVFKFLSSRLSVRWPEAGCEPVFQSYLPNRDCSCSLNGKGKREGNSCSLKK